MNDQEKVDALQDMYVLAATHAASGRNRRQVEETLRVAGLDAESAQMVTSDVFRVRDEVLKSAGKRNMLFGLLWCIGGSVVTAATYGIAAGSTNGGRYVVAWGAIVFGAIQFLRGVAQFMRIQ